MSEIDVSKGNEKYINSPTTADWYLPEKNIIDGVCVAHCVHFTRQTNWGYCALSNDSLSEFQENCKLNKNCYYKQLQQLKQENDSLKKQINYQSELKDNVKQKLEKIKEIIKHSQTYERRLVANKDLRFWNDKVLEIIESEE